jgi:hypothetical protein
LPGAATGETPIALLEPKRMKKTSAAAWQSLVWARGALRRGMLSNFQFSVANGAQFNEQE